MDRIIQSPGKYIQGANALGYLLTEDNRDLKFARELLERAYRAEPLNPYILDSMGWLNFREVRYRAAAEFTTASLKRLWDIEVAGHLVEIYAAQGKKHTKVGCHTHEYYASRPENRRA